MADHTPMLSTHQFIWKLVSDFFLNWFVFNSFHDNTEFVISQIEKTMEQPIWLFDIAFFVDNPQAIEICLS